MLGRCRAAVSRAAGADLAWSTRPFHRLATACSVLARHLRSIRVPSTCTIMHQATDWAQISYPLRPKRVTPPRART